MKLIRAITTIPFIFTAFNVGAAVVYEQLPNLGTSANRISSTLDFFGNLPGYTTADDFVLASSQIISDVHWWGGSNSGGNDFQFTFYADAGGIPGAALHTSGGSLSTAPTSNPEITYYSSDLNSPFSAIAGTSYWISVFNEAADASWWWQVATGAGSARQGENPGPPWSIAWPTNLAFQLTSASIAEPGPIVLLMLGLGVLCFSRRKRIEK